MMLFLPSVPVLALAWPSELLPWGLVGALGLVVGALGVFQFCCARRLQAAATERMKSAQDAVGANEQRWKLLFEQSPLSIQIFSPDGQTLLFNNAWRDLFRLSDEQGRAFNVLEAPDLKASGAVELIRRAFEGEPVKVPPVPFSVSSDPPQTRWIGGVLYPVKDADNRVMEVVVIHHDITEMKRAEEAMLEINQTLERRVAERTTELEAAQRDLAKALEMERDLGNLKSRFVSMVSHEFRTPLGVIMSAVELLRHYEGKLDAEQKTELLGDIRGATQSMASLMEQVLLLGRVEAGKLGFRSLPVDLNVTMQKIIGEVVSATNGKCPITVDFADGLGEAQADEALLRHIFSNLLSNAVKYSPAGSDVFFRARREGTDAVFTIEDKGIGIPEKDRAHLFEAFHRCENVGEIEGTGLGLVIVKRCVELHSGNLSFESEVGKGTSFAIRLPLFGD